MSPFHYQQQHFHAESVDIVTLADTQPTPFYCYSSAAFRHNYRLFASTFSHLPSMVCYALKANSNQAVLTLLAKEGAGADVVSAGELQRAIAAGIPAQKIVFSGVAKSHAEIEMALLLDIHCFNVESEPELRRISKVAKQLNKTAAISLRINPDVDPKTHAKISTGKSSDKFGIPYADALDTYTLAAQLPNIQIVGIDMHIGSQITQLNAFDAAISKICHLVTALEQRGIRIKHFNFGGGLAVAYRDEDCTQEQLLSEYAAIINRHAATLTCHFIFEPGRFIAASAGVLVTQVRYVKPVPDKSFVIVDAAMNDLIRPTLYEAWHNVRPVVFNDSRAAKISADIVGPVCETGDYLAKNRSIDPVEEGDLLIVDCVGAYGAVQSSSYNSRPLIAEVLVDGERWHTIRKAPSYQELIDQDCVPNWLSGTLS